MEITYDYIKLLKEFGRKPNFTESPAEVSAVQWMVVNTLSHGQLPGSWGSVTCGRPDPPALAPGQHTP